MKIPSLLLLLLALTVSCDRAQMGVLGAPVTTSGREKLSCGIRSHWGVFHKGQLLGVMTPFKGPWSSIENYNYQNLGPHFQIGPRDKSTSSGQFFFYQGSDGLSFQFSFGKEDALNSPTQVSLFLNVKHNKLQDSVLVSDEPNEFIVVDKSPDTVFYQGLFNYHVTIDGAVLGPLLEASTEILGRVIASSNLEVMLFEGAQGEPVRLKRSGESQDFTFTIKLVDVDPCKITP